MPSLVTDVYGQPVRTTKPFGPTGKVHHVQQGSRALSSASGQSRKVVRATPAPCDPRTHATDYMQQAANGAFRKKGLGKDWYSANLIGDDLYGPTTTTRHVSMQRLGEDRMIQDTRETIREALTAVDTAKGRATPLETLRAASTMQRTSPRRAKSSMSVAELIGPERAQQAMRHTERGRTTRPPMATVPTILHADDESYVDVYRNHLDDREARIEAKQRHAFELRDRFVVDPDTKLRTLRQHKSEVKQSQQPRADPPRRDNIDRFVPMNMSPHAKRATVEQPEQMDPRVTEFEREVFKAELLRLTRGQNLELGQEVVDKDRLVMSTQPSSTASSSVGGPRSRGPTEALRARRGTGSTPGASRTPSVVSSVPAGSPALEEYVSPDRFSKPQWATMPRAGAYQYQKQASMRRYADETALKKAYHQALKQYDGTGPPPTL